MNLLKKVAFGFTSAVLVVSALYVNADTNEEIAQRLAPVGSVCLAGECEQPEGAAPIVVAQAEARSGEEVYTPKCTACHGMGVGNAPKLGDKAAWEPRLAAGVDALVASAKKGKNAMPPMGLCSDCSDAELKELIEFMTK